MVTVNAGNASQGGVRGGSGGEDQKGDLAENQ
jgi:hypothetical protein